MLNQDILSSIEMNIAIMVSCASSVPQFCAKTKLHLHATAASLRKWKLSLVGKKGVPKKQSNGQDFLDSDISLDSYCVIETQGGIRNARSIRDETFNHGAA